MPENPLFIVVTLKYFNQFKAGSKPGMEEFRPLGTRWNERTCRVGRPCIISGGYGKQHRLHGKIAGFRVDEDTVQFTSAWMEIYGPGPFKVACIKFLEDPHA